MNYILIVLTLLWAGYKYVTLMDTKPVEVRVGFTTKQYTYYVIAGSFKEEKTAQNMVHGFKEYNPELIVIDGLYRIVIFKSWNLDDAREFQRTRDFDTIIKEQ